MAQKDNYVANVVNEEKVSQTPSVLVGKAPQEPVKTILVGEIIDNNLERDEIKGKIYGQLSPNPAHSGFDKQFFVDSLPEYPDQEDLNALFIIPQVKGDKVIGYEQWTFDVNTNKWRKVYGSNPNLRITKAPAKQAPQGANPPKRAFAQIFNGNVAINNGKLYINGKEVGAGGGGGSGGDGPKVYEVDDPTAIPDDILNQLKVNDVLIWPDEEAGSSVRGVVTKVIEGVSVEIYSIYDFDDVLCYWYWVVDDEWTCGEPTTYALSIILWAESVDDMDSDFVSNLDNNYMIRDDDNGKIWLSNIDNNGYIYLYNIGAESITYVRYAYDDVEETWYFDTSYGVDGYNVISLSGGGGGGSDNTIWLNIPYNMDIRDSVGGPTEVVIHDNTTLNELAKLLPLLTDPEKNVKVIWAGEIVSGSVGCEVFSDPNEGSYITLAFAEWAGPGTTITFNITIEDNAISQVTAKASRDDGIEIIYDLTKTYIVNNVDNYVPPETIVVNVPANFSQNYNISQPMVYNRNRTLHEPDPVDSDYDIFYWFYSNSFVDLDNDTLVYSEVCIIIKERTNEVSYSFNYQCYALTTV